MELTPFITFVFLIAVTALVVSLYDLSHFQCAGTSGGGTIGPVPPTPPVLSLLPDGDGLVVNATTAGQIQINGQAGIRSYGLTNPSNILTMRDLRNLSEYVVGPNPIDSEYQTVSSALAAADATGVTSNILLKRGTYDGETIDVATFPQVFTAVGKNTAFIVNSSITQSLNDTVVWENVVFSNSSINLTTGITQFFNCLFLNTTFIANGNSPNLYDCRFIGGISVTGGNALEFQGTSFDGAVVVDSSSFNVGPLNCLFSEFTFSNGIAPTVFEGCTFRNNVMTVTNVPSCAFTNCSFVSIGTTVIGPGTTTFNNCLINAGTFACIPSPNLLIIGLHSSFLGVTFSPFVTGVICQFFNCFFNLTSTIEFQGIFTDFQTARFCSFNNSIAGGGIMVRVSGATAYLRTNNCTFDGDAGGPGNIIFDLVAGATLVLFVSTLACSSANYVTGSGTIIRPSTGANTLDVRGTNLMQGNSVAAGGITITNTITPGIGWQAVGSFNMV